MFYGSENIFIADQALLSDDDKMLFHVKHNWFYHTGNENAFKYQEYTKELELIQFGDQRMLVLSDGDRDSIPQTNYVYLQNMNFINETLVADFKKRNVKVILGTGLKFGLKYYLENNLGQNQIHDLKKDGAFILDF